MDLVLGMGQFVVLNAAELVGFVLPPLVDWLIKDVKKDEERFIATVLICLVVAALLKWEELAVGSPEAIFTTASIIFIQSQVVYKLYFKASFTRGVLQKTLYPPEGSPTI